MSLNELLSTAQEAAELACREILDVYSTADFNIEAKADNSPLTIADKRAHHVIADALKSTGLPLLSEEGKAIPYSVRKSWKTFWMVDPLDGTKEFIKRNGEFTVNIALIENGIPIMGVVAVPVMGVTYFGTKGVGAFKKVDGFVTELSVNHSTDLQTSGLRVVASRSHMSDETQAFIDQLKNPSLVSKGSSLKFMLLADGQADVYPRFAPTMEWDTAAAHAVVNQCGFKVLQKGSLEELVYNKENLLNPDFVCL